MSITRITVEVDDAKVALDSSAALPLIQQYAAAKAAIKALEAEKDAAEAALRALLGDATEGMVDGVTRVTIAQRNRSNIDRKSLQEVFPEAYELCLTETPYTVFSAK
jgi:predicted phage-related endonuclease